MYQSLYHVQFRTHGVSVTKTEDGRIHVFKYNDRCCDLDSFDTQDEAEEYILEPFSTLSYAIIFDQ